jgi:hypothetical protein
MMPVGLNLSINKEALAARHTGKITRLLLEEFKMPSLEGVGSFFRKDPGKQHENINKENEIKLLKVPDTLWLHVYGFLDTRSLVVLTMACKTFHALANDPDMINKLGQARENKRSLNLKKLFFTPEQRPIFSHAAFNAPASSEQLIQIQTPTVYNDTPGTGFSMGHGL